MSSKARFSFRRLVTFWLLVFSISVAFSQDRLDLNFAGHYRNRPKTSIVRRAHSGEISNPKQYNSVSELIADLPADAVMRSKYPELNSTTNFPNRRKPEELWNVELTCWVHALKFEGGAHGDNDFHVIIGDKEDVTQATFLNVEISGLPAGGKNRAVLRKARQNFLNLFENVNISTSFKKISPPRKVDIKGSLFFDGDHRAGCSNCPGPSWAKPETVWEVHPIYSIESVQ